MTNPLLDTKGIPQFSQIKPEHVEAALDETLRRNREEPEQILGRRDEPSLTATAPPPGEKGGVGWQS